MQTQEALNYDKKRLLELAQSSFVANKKFLKTLQRRPPAKLDVIFKKIHDEVFSTFDCLECANCCKTLGPRITDKDIERLSKQLKAKPSLLFEKYFKTDEDGDTVFKQIPCPFLLENNYCYNYESRPKACREYPHTNAIGMERLLNLMLKNSFYCPGVYLIIKRLKELKL